MEWDEKAVQPNWLHRSLQLELKDGLVYEFRTFSLYDVWRLWPHFRPMVGAIKNGKPIEWMNHLGAVLGIVNAKRIASRGWRGWWTRVRAHFGRDRGLLDDVNLFRPAHVDALLEFYVTQQDWRRIQRLGDYTTQDPEAFATEITEREAIEPGDANRRFMAICMAAAKMVGMSTADFMESRFEFCADAIITLRKTYEERATEGKLKEKTFFSLLDGLMPTQKVDPENKPGWMQEMEDYAREAEAARQNHGPS